MKKFGFLLIFMVFFLSFLEAGVFNVSNPEELQNALITSQSNGEDDTIYVAPGTYNITQTLIYTTADGDGSLTIEGQDPNNPPILDGGGNIQIMNIENDGNGNGTGDTGNVITIRGIIFQNGNNSQGYGGALYIRTARANINIEKCTFRDNSAKFGGGTYLYSYSGIVTFTENIFTGNSASENGGGIYFDTFPGSIVLSNNSFTDNVASVSGGGVFLHVNTGAISLNNNIFSTNTASSNGGGAFISASDGTATLTNNTFTNNNSTNDGGGAYVYASTITLTNNTFTSNNGNYGGGVNIKSPAGTITLSNNKFIGNSANYGGGTYVFTRIGTATLKNNIFKGNISNISGGGANVMQSLSEGGTLILTNNIFTGNSSLHYAGARVYTSGGIATITNNTFTKNSATNWGGGVGIGTFLDTATLNIYNNIIWGNTANAGGNDGDDLYIDSDGDNNGTGSIINLYNNDLGENSDFQTGKSEDLYITNTTNYSQDNFLQNLI